MQNYTGKRTGQFARIRFIAYFVAVVQLFFGLAFLLAPVATANLFGFSRAPGWANWLLGMMAARFIGYGCGMLLAARNPYEHRAWIKTMIAVQAADWILTVVHIRVGDISAAQVPTALVFPILWIAVFLTNRMPWTESNI